MYAPYSSEANGMLLRANDGATPRFTEAKQAIGNCTANHNAKNSQTRTL